MSDTEPLDLVEYQRELFAILEEFFIRVAGCGIESEVLMMHG